MFDFICTERVQEILFLKSKCFCEKRITSGVATLINLSPGSKPGVNPCCVPAIWIDMRAKAAHPSRQLLLD